MQARRPHNLWSVLKPLVDAALIVLSFFIAYLVRYELQLLKQVEPAFAVPFTVYLPSIAALLLILLVIYWIEGAYRNDGRLLFDQLYIVFRGTLTGIASMIVIVFLITPSYYSRLIFGYAGIAICILVGGSRVAERMIIAWRHRHGLGVRHILIIGAGEVARSIMRSVVARPELGYRIMGFLDDDPTTQNDIGRYPALGTLDKLSEVLATCPADEVIVTLPWVSYTKIMQIMKECERCNIQVRIVPDLFQMAFSNVVVETLDSIPLLGIRQPVLRDWQAFFKRAVDVIISGLALIVLAPLLALVALIIKLDSPGPAVFRQTRVGRNGALFTVFKFRSMRMGAEAQMEELQARNEATGPLFKMRNDPRCTRVGRFVRRTSIDELPQLWNVLKGDMSIVGPRPPLPSEVEKYALWHHQRLDVSPGITGLWQVSGRSDLTFDEMVLLDIYYVENWSPLLDLRILLKTIPTILLGSGAY
jgi:exopolysaccharide biosynthesis polyprenyl glycosylphosphotransferase